MRRKLVGSLGLGAGTVLLAASLVWSCGGGNQDGGSQYKLGSEGGTSSGAGTSSGGSYGDGSPVDGSYGDGGINFGTCTNLASCQVTCADGGTTSLSGYVYDPAGKNPLYNVVVYIPTTPVKPITSGASCDQCGGEVTGNPLVTALTDATGHFVLKEVPVGVQLPLVMQLGKWRRQVTVPAAKACTDTPLTTSADKDLTRLPATQSEGNIPLIAVTTGGADPLECLLRKVGIKDSEFTTAGGTGRVQLYAGGGVDGGTTGPSQVSTSTFASALNDGGALAPAEPLWSSATNLEAYDILLMACEGAWNGGTKPPAALQAMDAFERAGGRVFMSHWQDYWIENGPSPLPSTGVWTDFTQPPPNEDAGPTPGTIDTSFPKGKAFHDWLANVSALDSNGQLDIHQSKANLSAVGNTAQQWVTAVNNASIPDAGATAIQYMSFNTPLDIDASAQCGRVVFSDLHVSAGTNLSNGDKTGQPFPSGCVTTDLSPQEKALEFMLFDLSSCIQSDLMMPMPPM